MCACVWPPTCLNSQMILAGLSSTSLGQCLILMEVCPSSTSAHSSVTELKRISFRDVYSKYWSTREAWLFALCLQHGCWVCWLFHEMEPTLGWNPIRKAQRLKFCSASVPTVMSCCYLNLSALLKKPLTKHNSSVVCFFYSDYSMFYSTLRAKLPLCVRGSHQQRLGPLNHTWRQMFKDPAGVILTSQDRRCKTLKATR